MSHFSLPTLLLLLFCGFSLVLLDPIFSTKPRIRREWRTLDSQTKQNVANAFWIMRTTSTDAGQKMYGPHYFALDELIMLHACAVEDIRCDQGHVGPHFMTFHRLFLLKFELSLLAIDPSVEALPYWNMAYDSKTGKYRHDPEMYIFSKNYFGSYQGNVSANNAVTDGLFANFPIGLYSAEEFGPNSPLAKESVCISKGYFQPQPTTTCTRCCGVPGCVCDNMTDTYPTYIRDHDDCTPYVVRDPDNTQPQLSDTTEILFDEETFTACSTYENALTWMSWQNCIDPSKFCNFSLPDAYRRDLTEEERRQLLELSEGSEIGGECDGFNNDLVGFYDSPDGNRYDVESLHLQAHFRIGADFKDVVTSPNDVALFSGHHSNIDRSNFHWMMDARDSVEGEKWTYPVRQSPQYSGNPPYGFAGPFSTYNLGFCGILRPDHYTDFQPNVWLKGGLYDDVVNGGFPFFNLFCDDDDECDGGKDGYTHGQTLYFSSPERTPYTYDTLAHFYYD